MAVSGWAFLWVRISTGDVFCGGGPVDCPAFLGEASKHIALFGMIAPATAIGVALYRVPAGPRFLSVAAVVAAAIGLVLVLTMTVADYDVMLSSISSGRLDLPDRLPLLPPVVRTLGALWPVFIGGWVTLTSLQLVRLGVPFAIAVLGVLVGFAIVVTIPYASEYFVYRSVLPLELILSLGWANSVGVYLTTLKGATSAG
jgi:hypothetical protein